MRSYSVDKPIIIKAHAVKYFTDPCLAPTPPKAHYPSPRTTTLASLVKGRWIGGKAQTLTLLHLLAIRSPFLYCKLFCRQDGGIATPPTSHRTNPSCCTECCHSHTTIAKEQQSLAQHFPYKTKRPHLITGAVLLILNLTASQDYRQAD